MNYELDSLSPCFSSRLFEGFSNLFITKKIKKFRYSLEKSCMINFCDRFFKVSEEIGER